MARTPRRPPRAEHIGSLLRPVELRRELDELGAVKAGYSATLLEPRDVDRVRAVEDEFIRRAVARQIDCGLDVVSDGEFRRAHFTGSFYDAVDGLRPATGANTRVWHNERGERITYPGVPVIERRLSKAGDFAGREAAFLVSATEHPFKVTFPAGSWFMAPALNKAARLVPGYEDEGEFAEHVIGILRELIKDAIAAGARYVQLDFPSYVYLMDEGTSARLRETGVDPNELLERCLRADRAVLDGMPDDVTFGLHLCRGNHRSSWLFDGSIEPVAERFFNELPYDVFLIEWEDTTREGDFSPLRYMPKGPVVVVGLVSTKRAQLESEDEVLARMEEASRFLDLDQLAVSPQCGFASTMEGNLLDEDTQWRKLELVGRVADRLWPRSG
ncbi:MAG: 5-methyltetrahydropteroyltriglutamate--homocysteine S-methyltransferase [Streptosporangiales bacterium]|nr:5-methyltetrahydropteroyltriglutamate--homocysteine S-methyltransferase [Streptosporangiales bacterium]